MSQVVLTHYNEKEPQGEQLRYTFHSSYGSATVINMIKHKTFTWW